MKTLQTQKVTGAQNKQIKTLVEYQLNQLTEQLKHIINKQERIANEQDNTAHPETKDSDVHQRMDRMERSLDNLIKVVEKTSSTWAQVTARRTETNNTPEPKELANSEVPPRSNPQKEKWRKERQECGMILTTSAVSEQEKKDLETLHPKQRVERFQNAIDQTRMSSGTKPILLAINKLDNGFRLMFKSTRDAKQAEETNWNLITPGLGIHKPRYGVVNHGVPKGRLDFDKQQTIITETEEANASLNLKITAIQPLRKNQINTSPHH